MINQTDPPTNQQIHHFKPTNQPIQTHHQSILAYWSQLADPRWSNLQNPKPSTGASFEQERCERGRVKLQQWRWVRVNQLSYSAMRDEREAVWSFSDGGGWEAWWSFSDEGWCLGLKRGESGWRNREWRERREQKQWERWDRNFGPKWHHKFIYIYIYIFTFWGCKCHILLRFGISIPQC